MNTVAGSLPRGLGWIVSAQFASALADHALIIVAIALLIEQGQPGWWAPMLKFCFTLAYVVLAPGVGLLADALPKGRLMAWMNLLKVTGVMALVMGMHPLLCLGIVGLGAAAYAPAKYGLITEITPPSQLVVANAWVEVSVVLAALLGTVLGGWLVSGAVRQSGWTQALADQWPGPATELLGAFAFLWVLYAAAALLNFGVPGSNVQYDLPRLTWKRGLQTVWHDFLHANRTLWADRQGGLSMAVTTLFWGFGATLQFAVLLWGQRDLGLGLDGSAYLQAAVAVGVVAGAALAGRWISLSLTPRLLPLGIVLGFLVPLVTFMGAWGGVPAAVGALVLTGAVGGLLVVPMNALMQHRGHVLLSAGRSIAVQGFNENLSVLLMLGLYSILLAAELSVVNVMAAWGLLTSAAMGWLWWRWVRGPR